MAGEWGIEVGYKVLPLWWVRWRKQLADWQILNDCCSLCLDSATTQQFIIVAYGEGPCVPATCNPFAPLYTSYTHCCTHILLGDFNNDFNNDFYK